MVRMSCKEIRDQFSQEEIEADTELKRFLDAERLLNLEIPRREAKNEELRVSIELLKDELTPHLKDKIVFLGYAATA